VALEDPQVEKKQPQNLEQKALAALRAHREKSGHIPWDHSDNDQLKRLDKKQRQHRRDRQSYQEAQRTLSRLASSSPPVFTPVAEAVSQVTAQIEIAETPAPDPVPLQVWIDPELGRLAVGLKKTGEYLLWSVFRHFYGQPGWTTREALFTTLKDAGVINTQRSFNRTLKSGQDLFWSLAGDRVYLRGYVKLSGRLTRIAMDTAPSLVATNVPGVRAVQITITGDLGDFKAQVYAGWLTHREDPTIARDTLCTLFAVVKDTLRNWEDRLGGSLEKVSNYGQTHLHPLEDERVTAYIPAHSYSYVTRRGEIRIRWRQPNTYRTKNIPQKHTKGQSRKARFAAVKVAWFQPVEICAHTPHSREKLPFDRTHREPKRYFPTEKALQQFLKRLERRGEEGIKPATPRYIYRGEDKYQHGIWEVSLDGHAETTAWERMAIKKEYAWWKGYREHQKQLRAS
jgi:hypothetical protein